MLPLQFSERIEYTCRLSWNWGIKTVDAEIWRRSDVFDRLRFSSTVGTADTQLTVETEISVSVYTTLQQSMLFTYFFVNCVFFFDWPFFLWCRSGLGAWCQRRSLDRLNPCRYATVEIPGLENGSGMHATCVKYKIHCVSKTSHLWLAIILTYTTRLR